MSAYVFYALYVLNNWSWVTAAAVAIFVAGPIMGLILELVARRIQMTSLALKVAATVGLLLVIEAAIQLIYGVTETRTVPIFLGTGNVRLLGTNVQIDQIVTFLFAAVDRPPDDRSSWFSRSGVAMRAVVDDPELLDMAGTSPSRTRRLAWVIGVCMAAASGVLFAPVLSLDPIQLTLLVVSAFGAAAIGAFTNIPLTLAGGLGIGVFASLCTKWFTTGLLSEGAAAFPRGPVPRAVRGPMVVSECPVCWAECSAGRASGAGVARARRAADDRRGGPGGFPLPGARLCRHPPHRLDDVRRDEHRLHVIESAGAHLRAGVPGARLLHGNRRLRVLAPHPR